MGNIQSSESINKVINVGKLMLSKKKSQQLVDSSFNGLAQNSSEFSDYSNKNEIYQDTQNSIQNRFIKKKKKVKPFKKDVLVKQWKNLKKRTNTPSGKWQLLG